MWQDLLAAVAYAVIERITGAFFSPLFSWIMALFGFEW